MPLLVVQPKSNIKTKSPNLIEIEYENRIKSRFWYAMQQGSGIAAFVGIFLLILVPVIRPYFFLFIIVFLVSFFLTKVGSYSVHDIKRVAITPHFIKMEYSGEDNFEKFSLNHLDYLDFKIKIQEDISEIAIHNVLIPLHNTTDIPFVVDGIARMLNMKYSDTARLSDGTEILTYTSKKRNHTIFPTVLKTEEKNDILKISDTKSQSSYLEINTKNGSFNSVEYAELIYSEKIEKKDKIVVQFVENNQEEIYLDVLFLINGIYEQVFQSIAHDKSQELTMIRDTERLFRIFEKYGFNNLEIDNK
jgi:hypothetical protein